MAAISLAWKHDGDTRSVKRGRRTGYVQRSTLHDGWCAQIDHDLISAPDKRFIFDTADEAKAVCVARLMQRA